MFKLKKRGRYWWFLCTIQGRRIRQSTKETKRERAELVAQSQMLKLKDHSIDAVFLKAPTLQQFSGEFLQWVESCPLDPDTKRYYTNGWRLLSQTSLAHMRMDEIANVHCEMAHFPGSSYSANTALRTLRRMFSVARELRRIASIPKIALREETPRAIAMDEAAAAQIAGRMTADARDAFVVLRATGMRPNEGFRLRWEYFLWEKLIYLNPKGKTRNARRPVPLLGDSYDVLRRRWLAQGQPREGWVFPSKKAPSGHRETIHKAFQKARKAAGLPSAMCLYTARHGVGTDLAPIIGLKATMDVLGHADVKTAIRYQHPDVFKLRAQLENARTNGRVN
jgi:integrase